MEITKREIIVSIAIAAILLTIGIFISAGIKNKNEKSQKEYNTAVQINNDQNLFEYGMRTNVGNAFVYGSLKVVDPVSFDGEVKGEYWYIKKHKEHYTMHTRQVAHHVSNGKTSYTYYTTETYYTWDDVSSSRESKSCTTVNFCGVDFDESKFKSFGMYTIDTIYEGSFDRWVYEGIDSEFTGTLYTKLEDNSLKAGSSFYNNLTIEQTIDRLKEGCGTALFFFWFFWIALIGVCIFIFYYADNYWLED